MGFDLRIFEDKGIEESFVDWLVEQRSVDVSNHFGRLWDYYANERFEVSEVGDVGQKVTDGGRCYVQGQEYGLPARITGLVHSVKTGTFGGRALTDIQRKEVVIENDIAWRVNAAVDFLFGKPIRITSKAQDATKRQEIETLLKAVFDANGAISFFQDMAVLGGVYGFVDCLIRAGEQLTDHLNRSLSHTSKSTTLSFDDVLQLAQTISLELIEAPRALPVLDEDDYKKTRYYVQHFQQKKNSITNDNFLFGNFFGKKSNGGHQRVVDVTEIISADAWQRYENGELVAEGNLGLGFLPVVHIQNVAQPYYYEGLSDVEPLMTLQDELNTRLCDRAYRITLQSFKMYLGKGIDGFEKMAVSPGRMWFTDNEDARIDEFGGDTEAPSEDMHISEIRAAMDKVSGITPIVAGVLQGKIGNLTSAVALKLTLMGTLSKNERKRFSYGAGIGKISRMILEILDKAGVYHTTRQEREIEVVFANPLPENLRERLEEAQIKKQLGVPSEEILKELGYGV